jgi:hypothetical protein
MKPIRNPFDRAVTRDFFLTGSIALSLAWPSAHAAPYSWTKNTAGTQDWTTVANWSGSNPFVSDNTNELIFFADTTTALVNGTNTITANNHFVGGNFNSGNATNQTSTLTLGAGTNVIATDVFNIGTSKASGTVKFAAQTAGSPGSVTIGGKTGATTNFIIGSNMPFAGNTGNSPVGILDFRGHLATVIGSTTGSANGLLNITGGNFTSNVPITTSTTSSTVPLTGAVITLNGGTLIVNGASDLNLGPTFASGTPGTTINMSGLSNFTYNSAGKNFNAQIFGNTAGSGSAILASAVTLATATNTITANQLNLGNNGAASGGGASSLNLGTTNTLNVSSINIGYSGRSNATLKFAAGLSNPTLAVRNTNGTAAASSWNVGRLSDNNASRSWTDAVDLTAGTLDAWVGTLNIGNADTAALAGRAGTLNATFAVGATSGRNLTVTNLNLGILQGSQTNGVSATGTFAGSGSFTHFTRQQRGKPDPQQRTHPCRHLRLGPRLAIHGESRLGLRHHHDPRRRRRSHRRVARPQPRCQRPERSPFLVSRSNLDGHPQPHRPGFTNRIVRGDRQHPVVHPRRVQHQPDRQRSEPGLDRHPRARQPVAGQRPGDPRPAAPAP